jgi:hypothetical protein
MIYNRLKRKLQTALRDANNATFKHYLTSLSPCDNSLWKATNRLKRPQISIPPIRKTDRSWSKSDEKAMAFADHLQRVFTPHFLNPTDAAISAFLDVPAYQTLLPQRIGGRTCAYQRTQGAWIRPHLGESAQRTTEEPSSLSFKRVYFASPFIYCGNSRKL